MNTTYERSLANHLTEGGNFRFALEIRNTLPGALMLLRTQNWERLEHMLRRELAGELAGGWDLLPVQGNLPSNHEWYSLCLAPAEAAPRRYCFRLEHGGAQTRGWVLGIDRHPGCASEQGNDGRARAHVRTVLSARAAGYSFDHWLAWKLIPPDYPSHEDALCDIAEQGDALRRRIVGAFANEFRAWRPLLEAINGPEFGTV